MNLGETEKAAYEEIRDGLEVWPEVGSRMMLRVTEGVGLAGGWIVVEEGRYRYAVDWSGDVTVRTVIWDYLATEAVWEL